MWMNVLETLTCAISMQLATILKGVTPALATLDMQAMGYFAQVSVSIFQSEHIAIIPSMYYSCTTLGQKWVNFVCFLCLTFFFFSKVFPQNGLGGNFRTFSEGISCSIALLSPVYTYHHKQFLNWFINQ